MRNYFIGSIALVALLIGCSSDGGSCCGADGALAFDEKGEVILLLPPIAKIDRNISATVSTDYNEAKNDVDGEEIVLSQTPVNKTYTFIFGCENSFDQDENNSSIERCDWNITKPEGCRDINATTGLKVKIICDDDTDNEDHLFVKLMVTDDENQTAEANTSVKF
ncbi:MAG TPA: hypothetical protein EYG75_04285 [Campylobacterales bacterium]|nr:hypothetical protein [Campylobacterales bacterium]